MSDDAHYYRERLLSKPMTRITSNLIHPEVSKEEEDEVSQAESEKLQQMRRREYSIYASADTVITISDRDKELWLNLFPELDASKIYKAKCLMISPGSLAPMTRNPIAELLKKMQFNNAKTVETIAAEEQAHFRANSNYEERKNVVYVGNLVNPTNRMALLWFSKYVFPKVHAEIPELSITVVGDKPSPKDHHHMITKEWQALTEHESFHFIGVVNENADLQAIIDKHRIFISPIIASTGINTKNLLAMSQGIPLVTTSIGAQSLELRPEDENSAVAVADSATSFAQRIVSIYRNEDTWSNFRQRAWQHYKSTFNSTLLALEVAHMLLATRP